MSDDESTKVLALLNIDVGKLTPALTKFVEVAGQGLGTLYEPLRLILMAKAEGKAAQIRARDEFTLNQIEGRALARQEQDAIRRQKNVESILAQTAEALPETVSEEPVDDDWLNRFYRYCEDVSSEQVQELWARILAGEIRQPGSYSMRALETLRVLSATDAGMFATFVSFSFHVGTEEWLCLPSTGRNVDGEYLLPQLSDPLLNHLQSLGLIHAVNGITLCPRKNDPLRMRYGRSVITVRPSGSRQPRIRMTQASVVGRELASLCVQTVDSEYFEHVVASLKSRGCEVTMG